MEVKMKSAVLLMFSFVIAGLIAAGCNTDNASLNPVNTDNSVGKVNSQDQTMSGNSILQKELASVRAATAKYHDINQAIADGYADINLYVPHMGWHYLNSGLLDGTFDPEKPELLVYANSPSGGLQLVAVEYAVPLSLSQDPPEGFTGDQDVWDVNTEFQLWTLHCWVWYNNPDGIFAEYNPRVE
jgi:hypothetical protein